MSTNELPIKMAEVNRPKLRFKKFVKPRRYSRFMNSVGWITCFEKFMEGVKQRQKIKIADAAARGGKNLF